MEYISAPISKKHSRGFSLKFGTHKKKHGIRKERNQDEESWQLSHFYPMIEELIESLHNGELSKEEYPCMNEPSSTFQSSRTNRAKYTVHKFIGPLCENIKAIFYMGQTSSFYATARMKPMHIFTEKICVNTQFGLKWKECTERFLCFWSDSNAERVWNCRIKCWKLLRLLFSIHIHFCLSRISINVD